jgi:UDP-GlcNAc:undecaprenyl-phosphate/decaprenyl-phosphate GlcNAc-1-phosphate transferase
MYALIALFLLSLLLCLVLTPVCREICLKYKLVDIPDGARRIHTRAIPRIGGVPIVLAYAGALGIMLAFAPSHARIVIQHEKLLFALLPATCIVFVTGLIDDLAGLKPWQKLFCQSIAAAWAVLAGARITFLDGQPHTALFAIPFSICWLIACTNAFNLIDGLDGLASGGASLPPHYSSRRSAARKLGLGDGDPSARRLPVWFSSLQFQSRLHLFGR